MAKNNAPSRNANNQNEETKIDKNDSDRSSRINSSSNPRNVPDTGKGADSTETNPALVADTERVGFEANGTNANGEERQNTRIVTGNKNDQNDGLVDVPVASRNKATGFPIEDRGLIHASEDSTLRKISYDEATNLSTALAHVTGYQVGSSYRHDFESGLETLRTFGLTYNVDRADSEAMRKQEEFQKDETQQAADVGAAND